MRTIFFVSGLVTLFLCIPVVAMAFGRRTYPGVSQWAIGAVAEFLGLALIGFRGVIPDFLSVVAGNVLVAGTLVFVTRGLLAFVGERQRTWLDIGIPALLAAALQAFVAPWPSVNARIAILSAVSFLLAGRCFLIVWRRMPRVIPGRDWLLLGSVGFTGVWHLLRAVLAAFSREETADFMASDPFQSLSVVAMVGSTAILFISLIVAKVKRLERDLEKLSGLLPICSGCKRIRDENGNWAQVETYIGKHSDVAFTHSLCPDCTRRLYPEAAAAMKKAERR